MQQISAGVVEDGKLVEDCLKQDPAAWSRLYEACHQSLVSTISAILRHTTADADINLVDEIAARVWYALVCNGGELLSRFDVARGCRLNTFLSAIAKNEARQFFRAERRRRNREKIVSRNEAEAPDHFSLAFATDKNFLQTLTPGERIYYESVLIAPGDSDVDQQYSPENSWQLRHRVRKKLGQYFGS